MQVAMFLAIDRVLTRVLRGIEAVHTGFWLGLMRPATLDRLTSRVYAQRTLYREQDHNRLGLFDWERAALERHFAGQDRVLVAACGGGRELLALAESGRDVAGFDPDPTYVSHAKEALQSSGVAANVFVSEPSAVPPDIGSFDAAIIGWGAYTHITSAQARIAFLRQIGQRLTTGCPVLLSFWERVPGYRGLAVTRTVADWTARLTGNPRKQELGDTLSQTFVHCFVEEEIGSELEQAGFELIEYASVPYAHAVAIWRGK